MREYEVTVIVQPTLEEQPRNELIELVSNWLVPDADEEAKPKLDVWGRRRMAYPIEKHQDGFYVLYHVVMDPTRIGEVERNMEYNEDILRYLVVRKAQ